MSTERTLGGSNNYDAVFTDKKDNASMEPMDFIKLMVVQMQNQDFNNPMDNSQMITQMAQFSNMQSMQEMAGHSKNNYAMAMVGKTVTASRFSINGDLDTTTGVVQKISLVDNEYVVYIGSKKYDMSQIMSIGASEEDGGGSLVTTEGRKIETSELETDRVSVKWPVPTEDEETAAALKYSVYYATEEPFDTVEAVEKGKLVGTKEQKDLTSETIVGLEPGTNYYINVVVMDGNGAKKVYKPVTVKTKEA